MLFESAMECYTTLKFDVLMIMDEHFIPSKVSGLLGYKTLRVFIGLNTMDKFIFNYKVVLWIILLTVYTYTYIYIYISIYTYIYIYIYL